MRRYDGSAIAEDCIQGGGYAWSAVTSQQGEGGATGTGGGDNLYQGYYIQLIKSLGSREFADATENVEDTQSSDPWIDWVRLQDYNGDGYVVRPQTRPGKSAFDYVRSGDATPIQSHAAKKPTNRGAQDQNAGYFKAESCWSVLPRQLVQAVEILRPHRSGGRYQTLRRNGTAFQLAVVAGSNQMSTGIEQSDPVSGRGTQR